MIQPSLTKTSLLIAMRIDPKIDAVTQILIHATNGAEITGGQETVLAAKVAVKQAVYETMAKMTPHFSTAWTLKTMLPLLAHIDNFKCEEAVSGANRKASTTPA